MQTQLKRQSNLRIGGGRKSLKVGVIGCGRIAEHHLRFVARTEGARLVAFSDPVLPNAERLADDIAFRISIAPI